MSFNRHVRWHLNNTHKMHSCPLPFLFNGFNQLVVYDLEKVGFRLRKEMSVFCDTTGLWATLLGGMVPAQVCKLCIGNGRQETRIRHWIKEKSPPQKKKNTVEQLENHISVFSFINYGNFILQQVCTDQEREFLCLLPLMTAVNSIFIWNSSW